MMGDNMNRRKFLGAASLLTGSVAAGPLFAFDTKSSGGSFPKGFMWGTATAAYQIEGNNINSDYWVLANVKPSLFRDRSGDACDSYNRFEEDTKLMRTMGLNAYRFSIEWARIEPNRGFFSRAETDYYKRVIAACRASGIRPTITFHHNTSPIWFTAMGGLVQSGFTQVVR